MKNRITLFCTIIIGLFLFINNVDAQGKRPKMRTAEILAILKVGQWAKLEGVVQKNFSVICKQVEILTGDFTDDDWQMTAPVRKINKDEKQFTLLRLPITTQEDTEFQENDDGTFGSFADLKEGLLVEVEGSYLKDGTFLALEVEDESLKLEKAPDLIGEVELTGKVEHIESGKQTITVMGITFQLTQKTKGKSVIK